MQKVDGTTHDWAGARLERLSAHSRTAVADSAARPRTSDRPPAVCVCEHVRPLASLTDLIAPSRCVNSEAGTTGLR